MIDFKNGSMFKLKKADGAAKEVEQLLIPGERLKMRSRGYPFP